MDFPGRLSRWCYRWPVVLAIAGVILLVAGVTAAGLACLVAGVFLALAASSLHDVLSARGPVPQLPAGFAPPSAALTPPCIHTDAVPVDLLLTGERMAWWCEACKTQLDADFIPPKAGITVTASGGGGGGEYAAERYRHWHSSAGSCASCRGSDASGATRCLCGQCTAAAAAIAMGAPSTSVTFTPEEWSDFMDAHPGGSLNAAVRAAREARDGDGPPTPRGS